MRTHAVVLLTGLCMFAAPAPAQRAAPATPRVEPPIATEISETVTRLPITIRLLNRGPHSGEFIVTHFKPAGPGPFPAVIVNHGRAQAGHLGDVPRFRMLGVARYWTSRGFAVFVPTRLGYGETGTDVDPEYAGPCNRRTYTHSVAQAGQQAIAAIQFAQTLPFVVADKIIVTGTSMGGITTTYVNGRNVPGVVAAINFAGGVGGNPVTRIGNPCDEPSLVRVFAAAGKGARAPMLWLYSDNDKYWGDQLPRRWHAAYVATGSEAEFVALPPIGEDGHSAMANGGTVWRPIVDAYLVRLGFVLPTRQKVQQK